MKFNFTTIAAAVTLGLANLSANAAVTLADFTIAEGSVPGAVANTFVADKLNGGYSEILTINPDLTYSTTAVADFGAFFKNDGNTLVTPVQLNGFGTGGYGLYAVFTSAGSFLGGNVIGVFTGAFDLYIDTNQDTTKTLGANGTAPVTFGNNSDDYRIASTSTLTSGIGLIGDPGAFDFIFSNLMLTTGDQNASLAGVQNGASYFTSPNPFFMTVNVDGDFDNFNVTPGSFTLTGDVSAVFISEPATIALTGLALFGVGLSRRRNKQ